MDMKEKRKVKDIRKMRSVMQKKERHKGENVMLQCPCVVMSVIVA